jgi:DNA-binding NtrC family response regulator
MAVTDLVLVVDDDAAIQEAIRRIVSSRGYSVLTASDPRGALRAAQAADGPIRVLLTDLGMPGDVSAAQLVEQLSARYPDLRVVFVSGLPKEVAVGQGLVGEDAGFLEKPFTANQVAETIQAVLADAE